MPASPVLPQPPAAPTDAAGEPITEPLVEADAAHQAERTRAPALLAALPLAGRGVTGDARSCQRALCARIRAAQGDELVVVNANPRTLLGEVALLVDQPPPGEVFATAWPVWPAWPAWPAWQPSRAAAAVGLVGPHCLSGHPGLVRRRPGAAAGARLRRAWGTTRQVRHLLTRLPSSVPAHRLRELARGHWAIANRLHDVREVTGGEDASTIRSGAAPQVLAALCSAHLALVRRAGGRNMAEAQRYSAWSPGKALRLLGLTTT